MVPISEPDIYGPYLTFVATAAQLKIRYGNGEILSKITARN